MNKIRFSLLLGLFLLLGWATTLATRPAGATPHQPSSSLLLPGDENWLPGFGSGFAGLSYGHMGLIAADNQGGFYATGQFLFAGSDDIVNLAHYHEGQWTPIILPASHANSSYQNIRNLYVDGNGHLYIMFFNSFLFKWDGMQIQTFDLTSLGYDSPRFLGTDALNRPYISGGVLNTSTPTFIKQWNGTEWVTIGTASINEADLSANQRPPGPLPGTSNLVSSMAFDAQNNLYFGGYFSEINGIATHNLAKWDGTSWTAIPNTPAVYIYDLELASNGQFYIAGVNPDSEFLVAYLQNGNWITFIADDSVSQIEVDSQNNVYVNGWFTQIGGVAVNGLAKWDGTSWTVPGQVALVKFNSFISLDNQDRLFLAEDVFKLGNETGVGVAVWDGTQWASFFSPTGNGLDSAVTALELSAQEEVYAIGAFDLAGGTVASHLAKWDGSSWQIIGEPNEYTVYTIKAFDLAPNGNIYMTGDFQGPSSNYKVAKWNGTHWSALSSDPFTANQNYIPKHVVINSLEHVFVATDYDVAKWDGLEWTSTGGDKALDLVIDQNDVLYGAFADDYVAMWDGNLNWTPLGDPIPGLESLVISPENEVYALGRFIGPAGTYLVLHWNGTTWETVGPATPLSNAYYQAYAGTFDSAGNLYVTGNFVFELEGQIFSTIARWDGVAWSPLGSGLRQITPEFSSFGYALVANNQGQLFVGGSFARAGTTDSSNIAVWSLPVQRCGLGAGGSHQFYAGQEAVEIDVTTAGTLDCVVMQQHRNSHPAAPNNLRTGYWWEIVALDANRQPAGGFEIDLTLPFTMFPAGVDDQLCVQTDTGWDCASASFEGQTITRAGVTQLGVWAVETTLFRQSLPIVVKR